MYKLVHIIQKSDKAHALIMQYTLSMIHHNIKHVQCQERYIVIHEILKKNKTRHKIKYFCLFEIFHFFFF